jgi:hypothetical protein
MERIKIDFANVEVESVNSSSAILFDAATHSPTFPYKEIAKVCKGENIPLMVRVSEYKGKMLANLANETLLAIINANYTL